MRPIFLATAAFALIAGSLSASAQGVKPNERYCADMKSGTSSAGKPSCMYRTMEQCKESVKDGQGTCMKNPAWKS